MPSFKFPFVDTVLYRPQGQGVYPPLLSPLKINLPNSLYQALKKKLRQLTTKSENQCQIS